MRLIGDCVERCLNDGAISVEFGIAKCIDVILGAGPPYTAINPSCDVRDIAADLRKHPHATIDPGQADYARIAIAPPTGSVLLVTADPPPG